MIDKINFTARVGFFSALHMKPSQLMGRVDNISRLFEEKTKNSDNQLIVEANSSNKYDTFLVYSSDYKEQLGEYVAPFSSYLAKISDEEASKTLAGILNLIEERSKENE